MAEGIRFTAESDDDDTGFESLDKDSKKKKKKASKRVGATILAGAEKTTDQADKEPPKNIFEQMKGWLDQDEKLPSIDEPRAGSSEKGDASASTDAIEDSPSAGSNAAESMPSVAEDIEVTAAPEHTPEDFNDFRTVLSPDELSGGEGVIHLRPPEHAEDVVSAEIPADEVLEGDAIEEGVVPEEPSVAETIVSGPEQPNEDEDDLVVTTPTVTPPVTPPPTTPPVPYNTPPPVGGSGAGGGGSSSSRSGGGNSGGGGSGGGSNSGGSQGGGGNAGGGGNVPRNPVVPAAANRNVGGYNIAPLIAANTFANLLAQRMAFEVGHLAGRTRGRVEGLVSGALVGAGIEHHRHKKREKKMEKKSKEAHLKNKRAIEELKIRTTGLETDRDRIVRETTKERYDHEKALKHAADAEIKAHESVASTKALSAEKARLDAEKQKAELIERLNARAAEQEKLGAAELIKDSGNRLETSAWHTMEVDKHGHVVEDSKLEYGHEYYRERAHETGPKQQVDVKAGGTAVAAAAALVAGGVTAQAMSPAAPTQQSHGSIPGPTPSVVSATTPAAAPARPEPAPSAAVALEQSTSSLLVASLIVVCAVIAVIVYLVMR